MGGFRSYGQKKPEKRPGRRVGPSIRSHRHIASLWDRDFVLPVEFLRDKGTYNESAIFFNCKKFKKTIRRLFRDLKIYGVMNLFWESEESEALVKQMKIFLSQFERQGRIAIFSDYNRKNLTVLNPDCKFMKVNLDFELCEFVNREEFRTTNKRAIRKIRYLKEKMFVVKNNKNQIVL